jgi:hypothetical protein
MKVFLFVPCFFCKSFYFSQRLPPQDVVSSVWIGGDYSFHLAGNILSGITHLDSKGKKNCNQYQG